MITQRTIAVLLAVLTILLVAFAVTMAFYGLIINLGDAPAARVLFWVAMGQLMALLADLVILVIALAVIALNEPRDRSGGES